MRGPIAALALSLLPCAAEAQRWSVDAAVGGDVSLHPDPRAFGIVVVDVRGQNIANGDLRFTLNTDTLQVGLENIALSPRVQLNVFARGEGIFAGMLPTYLARGERIAPRQFFASYAQITASVKWLPQDHHALELVLGARRWFFTGYDDTAIRLPPEPFVFEPRLRYVYWDLRTPEGDTGPAVFHPRFEGVAAGVELGLDLRDVSFDAPPDTGLALRALRVRERPMFVRQWIRAGARVHRRLRVQIEQQASYGVDEDDLTRPRVGGMNPYAVQIPGLPWPALLSERLVAGLVSAHWRVVPHAEHELGVAFGAGGFNDPARRGDLDRYGFFAGAALFADLRWSRWIVHLRGGIALPNEWLDRAPHVGAFVSVSRSWR